MLTVIPFGNYGEADAKTAEPVRLRQGIHNLGRHLGIPPSVRDELRHRSLPATVDYADRVQALQTLPAQNRRQLGAILDKVRAQLH